MVWVIKMEIEKNSLDDVLKFLYPAILTKGHRNKSSKGENTELLGVTLRILSPRDRLSRSENRGKPFSAIGELLWYLSGSDKLDFISPYIPDYENYAEDGIVPGAYGPRLFGNHVFPNQIDNVSDLLNHKRGSRRAVIQLLDSRDIDSNQKEIPCTSTLQFHIRENKMHMSVTMRSNDAYIGLPHDVFCFTMLHEMLARRLKIELGIYIHHVGSMHIYDYHKERAKRYLDEGYHETNQMPKMPEGDPFDLRHDLLLAESFARKGVKFSAREVIGDDYWSDIIRMIQVHWMRKRNEDLEAIKNEFIDEMFLQYLTLPERRPK